jgi:hypothetical protein
MVTPKVAQVLSQHLTMAQVKKNLRELATPRRPGPVPFEGRHGEAKTVKGIRELRSGGLSLQAFAASSTRSRRTGHGPAGHGGR